MSGVNLAEVLLDEMVILDCEPFKDKENMFDVMLKKALIENADIVYCDVEMVYEDGSHRYVVHQMI